MAFSLEEYRKKIEKALKSAGTYHAGLESQLSALAGALRTLDIANAEIDGLETTTVVESTRYGSKLAPHPVFKVQRDAADSVTKQLKQLGLTPEDLGGGDQSDPLVKLTKELKNVSRRIKIIRPDIET